MSHNLILCHIFFILNISYVLRSLRLFASCDTEFVNWIEDIILIYNCIFVTSISYFPFQIHNYGLKTYFKFWLCGWQQLVWPLHFIKMWRIYHVNHRFRICIQYFRFSVGDDGFRISLNCLAFGLSKTHAFQWCLSFSFGVGNQCLWFHLESIFFGQK